MPDVDARRIHHDLDGAQAVAHVSDDHELAVSVGEGPSPPSASSSSRTTLGLPARTPAPSASGTSSVPSQPTAYAKRKPSSQQREVRAGAVVAQHRDPSRQRRRAGSSSSSPSKRSSSRRRRRTDDDLDYLPALVRRGGCEGVDNSVLSCEPQAGSDVIQNQWFQFQWSSRNPLFNQVDDVHIYLFREDSGAQIGFWIENKNAGSIQVNVNDTFWGSDGPQIRPGTNQSFPLNFVIIPSNFPVRDGERTEPIFTAIQTALPNSIISSESEASMLSTASRASLSSQSVVSTLSRSSQVSTAIHGPPSGSSSAGGGGPSGTGAPLPGDNNGGGFPTWGIVLIAVLGFFVLLGALILAYWMSRRIRRQREEAEAKRDSIGSSSPMLENEQGQSGAVPTSPTRGGDPKAAERAALLGAGAGAAAGGAFAAGGRGSGSHRDDATASILSGSDSINQGMLSGADAAIVADAFRQAMRKPDFSGRPVEEDESPGELETPPPLGSELMSEELKKEGRDVRNVGSARGVQVQSSPSSPGTSS